MQGGMHSGHRKRLTAKIKNGDFVYDHELLEVLLFNSCPRKNLNATAHLLIDKFKSVKGVLCATKEELCKVHGVGPNMAEYICLLGECIRHAGTNRAFAVVQTTEQFCRFLKMRARTDREGVEFYIIDDKGKLLRIYSLPLSGEADAENLKRRIVSGMAVEGAQGLFAAHIRRGSAAPVESDDAIAREITMMCSLCGMKLYDFCILADGEFFSYNVADRLNSVTENWSKRYGL